MLGRYYHTLGPEIIEMPMLQKHEEELLSVPRCCRWTMEMSNIGYGWIPVGNEELTVLAKLVDDRGQLAL